MQSSLNLNLARVVVCTRAALCIAALLQAGIIPTTTLAEAKTSRAEHSEKLPRVRATVDVLEPGQRVETILDRVQLKRDRVETRNQSAEQKQNLVRERVQDKRSAVRERLSERVEKKREQREQLNETRAYQRREEIRERIRERIVERVRERRENK